MINATLITLTMVYEWEHFNKVQVDENVFLYLHYS